MEKNISSGNNLSSELESLLRKHNGLLQVNCKLPVKDRTALAQVYTPGVGTCCKLIQKDPRRAFDLTNKRNAVLVVSDASSFPECPDAVYPYLEAICAYYKYTANIDAYPMIVLADQDFASTVVSLMPAFSFVEFYDVKEEKIRNFTSDNKFSFVDSRNKRQIDNDLVANNTLSSAISSHLIYAAAIRASLDLQAYHSLDECVTYLHKYLLSENGKVLLNKSAFSSLLEIVKLASDFLIDRSKITSMRSENVKKKLQAFITQGKSAWVEDYPNNFLAKERPVSENSVLLHRRYYGVVETGLNIDIKSVEELNRLITWVNLDLISKLISTNPDLVYSLTCKGNMGAIITNGTAILGYGDIGALAGLPVMEGKCVLFKLFGGTNVMPLCIEEKNPKVFMDIVKRISRSFCAINLEDIKAPECFEIETKLIEAIPYPVFHDDQHGTAIVVLAGIINALKLAKKNIQDVKIVMNGAGAAGLSVTELLVTHGATNIVICDTTGAIYTGREKNMNAFKDKLAKLTNRNKEKGTLKEVLNSADIFIGVSAPKTLTKEMIKSMKTNPIIFALANPEPEIYPNEAKEAGALIVATGRSDFDNQVNNSLAFPGIFRAAIDVRARKISIKMKIAASIAIANLIPLSHLNPDFIIPDSLDSKVPVVVAKAVAKEARESGLAQNNKIDEEHVELNLLGWLLEEKLRNWDHIRLRNLEFVNDDLKPTPRF